MEFNEVINRRISVRSFLSDSVKKEDIDYILSCGMKAPVAKGRYDDYVFIVLEGEKLKTIQKQMAETSPRKDCTFGAPLIIVVGFKKEESESMEQSIGCLIENMELACTNIGLGSVFVYGIKVNYLNDEKLRKIWDLNGITPEACLCIGKGKDAQYIDKEHKIEIIR